MENTKKKSSRIKNIIITVLSVLVILFLLYGIGYSTGFIQRNLTAVKIGDYKVNALEYRLYYTDAKMNLIEQHGDAMQENGTDLSKPLESQKYTDEMSWSEYLHKSTLAELTEVFGVYSDAVKANHVMSEASKAIVETYMSSIEDAAELQKITADKYLNNIYGKNIGAKEYREALTRRYYAIDYIQTLQADYHPSEEDIQAYYDENPDKFDVVDYNLYHVNWETVEDDKEQTNKNKEAAKKIADDILARGTTAESFAQAVYDNAPDSLKDYYKDTETTRIRTAMIREDAGPIAEWYTDPERKEGDMTIIESDGKYTVLLFHSRYLEQYNSVSVRHILFVPADPEDSEDTDEVLKVHQECVDEAEAVYTEFLNGDKSEDSFAALAEEHSADSASRALGGLYEEFGKNEMEDAFEDWSFDEARKPGDTDIIQTDSGYHIMYFVGEGRPAWIVKAEEKMAEEYFDKIFSASTENLEIKKNSFAMNMAY